MGCRHPQVTVLSGASANIPERGPSQVAGTDPGPSPCGRGDASVAFRAPRSIPPTGLRPWVLPAHEAAGGHGPLGITPGLQDTLRRGSGERDIDHRPDAAQMVGDVMTNLY